MTLTQIEVAGIPVLIHQKPIKNMHLRVYPPDGLVKVTAPVKFKLTTVYSFIEEKIDWIQKHRKRIQSVSIPPPLQFQTGETLHFLGLEYQLVIKQGSTKASLTLDDNLMLLSIPEEFSLETKKKFLIQWYKNQLANILPCLINKWEQIIGVSAQKWGIKLMKTRWGSCNPLSKRICLNLALIKKPIACIESVIVHELIHILEPSHNKRFYALMTQFMPEWPEHKNALRYIKIPFL
ncbi:zinc metalloprotease [Legionella adelaidensis]|uniref:Zinc metalloprotease n=1 Tax=Legionella adelaidensis TaxID=45056 RepID=A0A0W0R2J2_9GAMM|nr:SprT family zinc-dependent metalloprotease [Legionella adelaidensis]KTC65272.1 zinc metalloprotease [Legionella adelaidensis]